MRVGADTLGACDLGVFAGVVVGSFSKTLAVVFGLLVFGIQVSNAEGLFFIHLHFFISLGQRHPAKKKKKKKKTQKKLKKNWVYFFYGGWKC